MTSRTSKNTRPAKRRAAKTTKHTLAATGEIRSDKKWAEAVLFIKSEGGFQVPRVNPFIQETGSSDTVTYVIAALEYMSRVKPADEGVNNDPECQFGQHLLISTLIEALKASNVQGEHEFKVARARGIIDALKGGAR